MKIYEREDGTYVDEKGREVPADVANSTWVDAFTARTGRTGRNMMRNALNLFPGGEMMRGDWGDVVTRESPEEAARIDMLSDMHPIGAAAGGGWPAVVSPGPGKVKAPIDAGTAFVQGVVAGDPNEPWYRRGGESLAGWAVGDSTARVLGGAFRFLNRPKGPPDTNPLNREITEAGEAAGGQYTPYQKTGDELLAKTEQKMETGRFTSGTAKQFEDENAVTIGQQAGRAAGLTEDQVRSLRRFDDDAMDLAEQESKKRLNVIADQMPGDMVIDGPLADALHKDVLTPRVRENLKREGLELPEEGPITIDGNALMRLRTKARQQIPSASDTLSDDIEYFNNIVKDLDDVAASYVTGDVLEQWQKERSTYATIMAFDTPSMRAEGNLPPKMLWNRIKDIKGGPELDKLQALARADAATNLKIPYNYSRTASSGLHPMADAANAGLMATGVPQRYYADGAGDTYARGLLDAMMEPTNDNALYLGRLLGRGIGMQE